MSVGFADLLKVFVDQNLDARFDVRSLLREYVPSRSHVSLLFNVRAKRRGGCCSERSALATVVGRVVIGSDRRKKMVLPQRGSWSLYEEGSTAGGSRGSVKEEEGASVQALQGTLRESLRQELRSCHFFCWLAVLSGAIT